MTHSCGIVISVTLSSNMILGNQSGPCLQSKVASSSLGETPRKGMSEGLSFPGPVID